MGARAGGYRGGYRGGRGGNHSYAKTQKGLFEGGTWKCDCNPRQPALHLETKKNTVNKGRWFYSCQKGQGDSENCGFFLWQDDARLREARAVLGNSRTEPVMTPAAVREALAQSNPTPAQPPAVTLTRATPRTFRPSDYGLPPHEDGNKKRNRSEDTEESYGWDNSVDTVELAQLGQQFDTPVRDAPETPRKAAKTDAFVTPSTSRRKLPWVETTAVEGGLPSPQTNTKAQAGRMSPSSVVSNSSYVTAGSERQKEILRGYTLPSVENSPTPSRFRDVDGGDGEECKLITDVLEALQVNHVKIDDGAKEGVRRVLNKFDLRTQGIIKGREISRLAIKAKDAKITELQLRISTLEAELETEKALAQHFKWKADNDQLSD